MECVCICVYLCVCGVVPVGREVCQAKRRSVSESHKKFLGFPGKKDSEIIKAIDKHANLCEDIDW